MRKVIVFSLILLGLTTVLPAQSQVLLKAMQDELERSMASLKMESAAGPYFMSYLVKDVSVLSIVASSGALTVNNESRNRSLRIEVRVGDYNLDNSNFTSGSSMMNPGLSIRFLPIDDDYDAIRRLLWMDTDRAYKQALDSLAKKKAYLANTVRTEVLPDYSREEKVNVTSPEPAFVSPRAKWVKAMDEISKVFLKQDKIQKSRVVLDIRKSSMYYINSEGTVGFEPAITTRLTITASTQADDGMPLKNFLVFTGRNPDELPAPEAIVKESQRLVDDLVALRTAPIAEEYSGPVLFTGEAAAEVMAQGLAPNLAGRKLPMSDNPQVAAMAGRLESPFQNKINTRVISNFVSVTATPLSRTSAGRPLLGSYSIDEEGVRAQDVALIDKGILKSLLVSRSPIRGFDKSNGHSRGGSAAPSVIHVTSDKKLPMAELKNLLIEKAKEDGLAYAYLVRTILPPSEAFDTDDLDLRSLAMAQMQPNPSMFNLTKPALAFKVFPDGREQLVRGASFGGVGINGFKDLLATSDEVFGYDFPVVAAGLSGAGSMIGLLLGGAGLPGADLSATVITPAFIMPGVDIKKPVGDYKKLPIVAYPGK